MVSDKNSFIAGWTSTQLGVDSTEAITEKSESTQSLVWHLLMDRSGHILSAHCSGEGDIPSPYSWAANHLKITDAQQHNITLLVDDVIYTPPEHDIKPLACTFYSTIALQWEAITTTKLRELRDSKGLLVNTPTLNSLLQHSLATFTKDIAATSAAATATHSLSPHIPNRAH